MSGWTNEWKQFSSAVLNLLDVGAPKQSEPHFFFSFFQIIQEKTKNPGGGNKCIGKFKRWIIDSKSIKLKTGWDWQLRGNRWVSARLNLLCRKTLRVWWRGDYVQNEGRKKCVLVNTCAVWNRNDSCGVDAQILNPLAPGII